MENSKQLDLIVLGNVSIDNISIEGNGTYKVPGGSAAAVATAAAICDSSVGILTQIGKDFPKAWLKQLSSFGVDTTGALPRNVSCRFDLEYNKQGDLIKFNEIFTAEDKIPKTQIPPHYLNAKHFHISAAHPQNQRNILAVLPQNATRSITLWPSYKNEYSKDFEKLLKEIDILFCNSHEIKMISHEENIYDATKSISSGGKPKTIVLTKGHKGTAVYHKRKFRLFPALRTSKLDTTGCGDSFAGGFLSEFIKTGNVETAGWYGAATASFTMSKMGSWFPEDITKKQIDGRVKRAKDSYTEGTETSKNNLLGFF